MKCTICDGAGFVITINKFLPAICCEYCDGTGEIKADPAWKEAGEKLMRHRLDCKVTLREAALRLGKDVVYLVKMEHGFEEPDVSLYNIFSKQEED